MVTENVGAPGVRGADPDVLLPCHLVFALWATGREESLIQS